MISEGTIPIPGMKNAFDWEQVKEEIHQDEFWTFT